MITVTNHDIVNRLFRSFREHVIRRNTIGCTTGDREALMNKLGDLAGEAPSSEHPKRSRSVVQDQVLANLKDALMSGVFLPGHVFSLRKLASSLGTSAMPVRESLNRLVAAHALEELPNGSVRVPKLSAKGLKEIFEIRLSIEAIATRIACETVGPSIVRDLREINDALLKSLKAMNMTEVLRLNQKFHFTIYEAADSEVLMPIIESLWLRCGPTMYYSFNSPNNLWDNSGHRLLQDAFKKKDPEAAQSAMVLDIGKTRDFLINQASIEQKAGPFASLGKVAV
ncbi:FCD domain-containing protein [Chelativorans multitrophicus]